jgi:four helix bundle protein
MEWFAAQPGGNQLSSKVLRRLDEAGTSVVLNIAEGNGRYAELDHHRFLEIAQSSAVKAAVYLDLSAQRGVLDTGAVASGKEIVRRVGAMLTGF